MNIHPAQSPAAIAELQQMLTMDECFISVQDSKPMVTIKQDTMSGCYKLTYGKIKIDKPTFFDILSWLDMSRVEKKTNHIKFILAGKNKESSNLSQHKSEIAHLETLIKRAKTEETKQRHRKKIEEIKRLMKGPEIKEEDFFTGHNLLSYLLPDDFEYYCNNKTPDGEPISPLGDAVVIERGVLLSGTLNKDAIGNISGSLIHCLSKDYGNKVAAEFVSELQIFINLWLTGVGITVSLEDCVPTKLDKIESEMNKAILEAYNAMEDEKDEELKEQKISFALNKTLNIGQKIAKDALTKENNMVIMIRSGSKGNWYNISQVTGLVGQQFVSAARLPKMWGGRTLPHFRRCGFLTQSPDTTLQRENLTESEKLKDAIHLFQSRGFILSPYYKGLSPTEYFFHACGGREGLVD